MRCDLQFVLAQARTLPPDQLPALIGELAELNAVALSRLSTPPMEGCPDENVDVTEAARRLHVSIDYLYRNHPKLSFTRREGRKLRFSSEGIDQHLKKSQ
jgi:hypothetical protein